MTRLPWASVPSVMKQPILNAHEWLDGLFFASSSLGHSRKTTKKKNFLIHGLYTAPLHSLFLLRYVDPTSLRLFPPCCHGRRPSD